MQASSAVYRPSHAVRRNSRGWVFAVQPSVQLHDARPEYARLITIRVESPASCRLRQIQRECVNVLRLNCRIPSRNVPQIIICYGHEDYIPSICRWMLYERSLRFVNDVIGLPVIDQAVATKHRSIYSRDVKASTSASLFLASASISALWHLVSAS